jgi:hypothetical protein
MDKSFLLVPGVLQLNPRIVYQIFVFGIVNTALSRV